MRLARPDERGRFGDYGGTFAPETLMPALKELEGAFIDASGDPAFRDELSMLLSTYVGRPTPVYHAGRMSEELGLSLYLKREDLAHTGAHKINNTVAQGLLTKRMGKQAGISSSRSADLGLVF